MEVVVGIVDEVVVGFVGMVDGGDGGFGMGCFWVYQLNMVVCGRLLGEQWWSWLVAGERDEKHIFYSQFYYFNHLHVKIKTGMYDVL